MAEQKQIPGGLVVIFEGLDGVGKTTQLERAAETLQDEGWTVQKTRAHGGTPIGEALRGVSLSQLERPVTTDLHITLGIHAALSEQLEAWRQQGSITLIDRGPLSVAAYQLFGSGYDRERGWEYVDEDVGLFGADLILTYIASVDIALPRARQKSGASDYFESKPHEYFERVEQGFLESSERYGATVIDAGQSKDAVHELTMGAIRSRLKH